MMSPWGLGLFPFPYEALFPDVATRRNHSHVSTRCGDHNKHVQGLYMDIVQ